MLTVCVLADLRLFLSSESGAALRVIGVNADLAPSLGIGVWTFTIAALALTNGHTGMADALLVQLQGMPTPACA